MLYKNIIDPILMTSILLLMSLFTQEAFAMKRSFPADYQADDLAGPEQEDRNHAIALLLQFEKEESLTNNINPILDKKAPEIKNIKDMEEKKPRKLYKPLRNNNKNNGEQINPIQQPPVINKNNARFNNQLNHNQNINNKIHIQQQLPKPALPNGIFLELQQPLQQPQEPQKIEQQMPIVHQKGWNYNPANARNATPEEEELYARVREKMLELSQQIGPNALQRVLVNVEDAETLHKNNIEICEELFNHKWLFSKKFPGVVLHGEQADANLELRANNLYLTLLSVWEALIEANNEKLFIDFFINAFVSNDRQACLEGRFKVIDTWYQKNKSILKIANLSPEEIISYKTIQDNVLEQAQAIHKKFMEKSKEGLQLKLFGMWSARYQALKEKIINANAPEKVQDDPGAKLRNEAELANVQLMIQFLQSQEIKIGEQYATKELYKIMLEEVNAALLNKKAHDGLITSEKILEILEIQMCWEF